MMGTGNLQNALQDVTDWPLQELMDAARLLAGELASRLADPGLVDRLPRFPQSSSPHPADEWALHTDVSAEDLEGMSLDDVYAQTPVEEPAPRGTLPELHLEVEALGRSVDAARTALAGHTAQLFDQHPLRDRVLGIPEGKCAYRSAVEYLRDRLRITRRQARSRIERSRHLLATFTLDHTQTEPPRLPQLARASAQAEMDPAALDVIVATLTAAREAAAEAQLAPGVVDALLAEGEQSLVSSGRELDPDALGTVCAHWRSRFDAVVAPDGPEPTEARRAGQGLFYRGRRDGLHRWSLVAADGQHEILRTITAAASDTRSREQPSERAGDGCGRCTPHADVPRVSPVIPAHDLPPVVSEPNDDVDLEADPEADLESDHPEGFQVVHDLHTVETSIDPGVKWDRQGRIAQAAETEAALGRAASHAAAVNGESTGWNTSVDMSETLEERSKGQRELDSLISALTGALALTTATGSADGGGGTRPQVLVTIDYQSLLEHTGGSRISEASYVGAINPTTIRAWACDADVIPVVLGGDGEVLDVGRARRLFTRKLRRALVARDGGCAAPGCTIPAPWCEAHHIEHWEHGGPTSVDNGVLLCSHHHHVVHAGGWTISMRNGIPWFIPSAYHDPHQRPRRNHVRRPRSASP
jgi:hypothetical protein